MAQSSCMMDTPVVSELWYLKVPLCSHSITPSTLIGWTIITVSRSREDTEWMSSGEIRIMAPSMLLIFKHYVPILDKHVKKLALSRKHGERQSPGQPYNSPTAPWDGQTFWQYWTSKLQQWCPLNITSMLAMDHCTVWTHPSICEPSVWGCRAVAWAFWSYQGEGLTAKEETFLRKRNWNPVLLSLKIMFKF